VIFGIDLGTTNSLIAYLKDGVPTPIPNVFGEFTTPSVVALDENNEILVGRIARERLYTAPRQSVASFKRLMGSTEQIALGKRHFRPEDLSALVLRSLAADAEAHLNERVEEVVISVPAYFNDTQRKATRLAGELAGLSVKRLINEPTAAALFHGIADREDDATFLVFDLGGGTFDVSILERFSGVMEVRATGGDSFLGGDDFTEMMMRLIAEQLALPPKKRTEPKIASALRFAAESAKRALSEDKEAEVQLPAALGGSVFRIAASDYESACSGLLQRLRSPVEQAMRDARLQLAGLAEIVLVGGATRMPMIRRLAAQLFGRLPARYPDPDQTIALGAAVCAGLVGRDAAFEEMVLADVCPHSLGTSVSERDARGTMIGDIFLPIIERNTVVPASRVKTVQTVADFQEKLRIDIYQGESRQCSKNVHLGGMEFTIPLEKAGEVKADIRYTYDVNGILDVDIDIGRAGISKNLLIKKLSGDVSEEEIERRRLELAELKVHPRDQEQNRLLLESGDRLYEHLLGDERQFVGSWLDEFRAVLERQDPREIKAAGDALKDRLAALERGGAW
jgi:molecular chaperone HscC